MPKVEKIEITVSGGKKIILTSKNVKVDLLSGNTISVKVIGDSETDAQFALIQSGFSPVKDYLPAWQDFIMASRIISALEGEKREEKKVIG